MAHREEQGQDQCDERHPKEHQVLHPGVEEETSRSCSLHLHD